MSTRVAAIIGAIIAIIIFMAGVGFGIYQHNITLYAILGLMIGAFAFCVSMAANAFTQANKFRIN